MPIVSATEKVTLRAKTKHRGGKDNGMLGSMVPECGLLILNILLAFLLCGSSEIGTSKLLKK